MQIEHKSEDYLKAIIEEIRSIQTVQINQGEYLKNITKDVKSIKTEVNTMQNDQNLIREEIKEGFENLSIVIVDSVEQIGISLDKLQDLREMIIAMKDNSARRILGMCPFAKKENIA